MDERVYFGLQLQGDSVHHGGDDKAMGSEGQGVEAQPGTCTQETVNRTWG